MAVRKRAGTYEESSIKVLKGLEPVKQRPGMYTLTDTPLHIIQEVLDNASDEVLAGYGDTILVTLGKDGSVTVEDNGRGIPAGIHPVEGVPTVQLVFTQLHAGGKFDKASGGAYSFSGGLHGVGVSVTNALSLTLDVTVWRDGRQYDIGFAAGAVARPLTDVKSPRPKAATGTRVTCVPDPRYFDSGKVPEDRLVRLLKSKAVLLPGCSVIYRNEASGLEQAWKYEGGLKEYLLAEIAEPLAAPVFEAGGEADEQTEGFSAGEGAQWVVCFTEAGPLTRESFVNLIPTPDGGTHEAGLKEGLFGAMKAFMEAHGLLAKSVKLLPEDIFARASFVLSAKCLDPQFQGQTKEKLTSRDALKLVSSFARPQFEFWLNDHVEEGKKIAELVIRQAQSRQRQSQRIERRKTSSVAVLPGKLTDCESTDITRNELFLVEGDSAGGTAKQGRNKDNQAVLPLRGKVLNTWEVDSGRIFASQVIHDIAVAIGVDPHKPGDDADLSGLRYGKICILADADVDGSHIQVLLLTLFYRHFPKLVTEGHVFVAQPPLFRVDVPKAGRRPERKIYCADDGDLSRTLAKLRKEGIADDKVSISRFKGLGEMKESQLAEAVFDPDTRRLWPVTLGELEFGATDDVMSLLMAKGEAGGRRSWMELHGEDVEVDV
ncbi:MAG: type IIA DNA topoisomerase subunit B [Duodenibacillus sp.]|nr:type IIA DNA topoisomerase subunit B [Duodenibacillus sp.]